VHHAGADSDNLLAAVMSSPARSRRTCSRYRKLAQFTGRFNAGLPGPSHGTQTPSALSIARLSGPGGPGRLTQFWVNSRSMVWKLWRAGLRTASERIQQALKKWMARPPPAAALTDLQQQLDAFTSYYNTRRPHASLPHQATPRPGPQPSPVTVLPTSTS
jgi:transposase InsO family protein